MDNREKLKFSKKSVLSAPETMRTGQIAEAKRLGKKIIYTVKKVAPGFTPEWSPPKPLIVAETTSKKLKAIKQQQLIKAMINAYRQEKIAKGVQWLIQHYPKLFTPLCKKPLALGIRKSIRALNPTVSCRLLEAGLKTWIQTADYCQAVIDHTERYDLEGKPCGVITESEKAYAKQFLASAKCRT